MGILDMFGRGGFRVKNSPLDSGAICSRISGVYTQGRGGGAWPQNFAGPLG